MKRGRKEVGCPVETTLGVLAGRWKVLILHYLLGETRRFNELERLLRGVSHRTLTRALRDLERDGIVRREVFAQVPPRVDYSLTKLGKSLEPILQAMHEWGEGREGPR
jgi:DNA-binding HxlR family transcriptional regulator